MVLCFLLGPLDVKSHIVNGEIVVHFALSDDGAAFNQCRYGVRLVGVVVERHVVMDNEVLAVVVVGVTVDIDIENQFGSKAVVFVVEDYFPRLVEWMLS